MNVMVFDVPAVSGGALTILNEYYERAVNDGDKSRIWYFVVSLPELQETENVKILRFKWIKKSWVHRMVFDYFIAPSLIKKYNIDEVLSLQNVIIPRVKVKQKLYLHQPLPFIDKKFKLTEDIKFWIYQNIISVIIFKSVKRADKVIVQTNWMRKACVEKTNIDRNKISVVKPKISIEISNYFKLTKESMSTFFYPASGLVYKNHSIIVDAAILLKKSGNNDFKIVFTIKGNENKHIAKLYKKVKANALPIEFVGYITLKEVYDFYSKSILVFPSYIETYGLPMLEARMHKTPVYASDCAFSHEVLDGYKNCSFFEFNNSKALSKLMEKSIKGKIMKEIT